MTWCPHSTFLAPNAALPPGIGRQNSQLVDEDVRDPDAVRGDRQLGDVVEVLGVPLEKLVRPILGEEQAQVRPTSPLRAQVTGEHRLGWVWVSVVPKSVSST